MPVKAGDLEVVANLRDDVSGKLDKMEGKAATTGKGMEKSLGGIQNAVNAINLDRAAESVRQFGERSSDVTKVRIAFESVAAQAELSDALILESAKEATKGLLTEHDIRLNANKALSLGVVENEQDFANLAEAAIILGQKLAWTPGQAVEDLTTGIGRQSVPADPGQPRDHASRQRGICHLCGAHRQDGERTDRRGEEAGIHHHRD